jgi:hypothetical protein
MCNGRDPNAVRNDHVIEKVREVVETKSMRAAAIPLPKCWKLEQKRCGAINIIEEALLR